MVSRLETGLDPPIGSDRESGCDNKGGIFLVVGVHSDMIITRESVHKAEELVANSGIHYEVDSGQGKAIFRASPVNISKVNAESPFSICLLDENHISQPIKIIYFLDSSGLEEFADLFVDLLLPF